MRDGSASRSCVRARKATRGGTARTIAASLKLFCGSTGRERPGADLPDEFGKWNCQYQRFRRWAKKGVCERIFNELRESPDCEYLIIDATIVRAHQHAAGAKKGR
jgi:putative transposase